MFSIKRITLTTLIAIFLLPLWMYLAWLATPKKKFVAAIIDKTVLTQKGQEHVSFTWLLNHNRYTKTGSNGYKTKDDYFGFFPLEDEKYRLKGLERFSPEMIEKLSNDADMVYLTDTYGMYKNEWYTKKNPVEYGMIYGGMSEQDVELAKQMKAKNKLVVTEFNIIGSPTTPQVRSDFENNFGLKWSGWIGRFFPSLDTAINSDLPPWLIKNYKAGHNGQWPFHAAGIAFISSTDQVVILEEGKQLTDALPIIESNEEGQQMYDLPKEMRYSFWFDIIMPDTAINKTLATFKIAVTPDGLNELNLHQIPSNFPAIITNKKAAYRFYYFSGDFCDNPVSITSSYFKGIRFFKNLFYNSTDNTDRRQFFWNFYRPLMNRITDDYYQQIKINGENISGK